MIATGEGLWDTPGPFNCLRVWDATEGREIYSAPSVPFTGYGKEWSNCPAVVAFHPSGKTILTISVDGLIRVRDASTGKELLLAGRHDSVGPPMAFLADGRTLAVAGGGGITFWEMPSERELKEKSFTRWRPGLPDAIGVSTGGVNALSPDGRIAASGGAGNPARISLRDAQTGKELRVFGSHRDRHHALCFSPDGARIASASRDLTVRIWDVANGDELHCLEGHKLPVLCVAWSPDGKTVLSGSDDDTLRLWNPDDGTERRRLEPDAGTVLALAYSPDGKKFVAATTEKILIWTEPFDKPPVKIDRQPLPEGQDGWRSSNMRWRRDPKYRGPKNE